ncbi:glycine betaine ABC transporter substrate-binding protein [Aedoeadaptatus pacaensis]|uniref:glycine betaine ABC transporter substrate-binding protein n=1 Tax=Aedoeadaptatus pacaensis TaxID=1776390 RepID=UPI00083928D8|nr:glycine betaine ABC transporter substrate-binding protein [Peptoniphilus pacaensis]
MMKKFNILLLVLAMALFSLTGCKSESKDVKNPGEPIRFGSQNDEEGYVLGAMMQQMLEHNGYEVDAKVGQLVNNTSLMRGSIMEDQLDMTLDYTGRGLMFIEGVDQTLYQKDEKTAYETTKEADKENGIIWLTYAPANNTDALCVTKEFSEKNNVKSLKDLGDYIKQGNPVKLAIQSGYEYYTSAPTTLPGWKAAYGLDIPEKDIITGIADARTALAQGTDGINVVTTSTTNGLTKAFDFVILDDPDHVSPFYSPAPLVSAKVLEKYPDLEHMFDKMFASLDKDTLTTLNAKFEEEGVSEVDVAKEYLEQNNYFED